MSACAVWHSALIGFVCLLLAGCGEAPPGQGAGGQDAGTGGVSASAGPATAAKLKELEDRIAVLERRVSELAGARDLPSGRSLFRDGGRRVVAEAPAPSSVPAGKPPPAAPQPTVDQGQAVDFTNAIEGQIFPQYGSRNMVVKTSAGLGLTSASSAPVTLVFSDFSLAERMEVVVSLRTGFWTDQQIRLLNDDRAVITVTLSNYDLKFGDHAKKRSTTGWKRGEERNQLRIAIENNNAWLYVNKRFFGVQQIELARANRLEISGIKRDQDFVYSVFVRPLS